KCFLCDGHINVALLWLRMFSCHKKISSLTNSGPERRRLSGEVLDAQNRQGEWMSSLLAYRLLYFNGCSGKG
ncbi:hypothetical protein, partial [Thermogemmatispora sp.]|uniref:hypothetical protein n=1 Tax=Thermogemmatispora sp. TaxID=1968838 RepID=UPI002ACC2895